nr:YggS family pyridoxal phosphate-dependent enzyme [Microbacterium amylolyticum]
MATRLAGIDENIADAARNAGRSPDEITRIVVTKFHPASLVRELADLGVHDVGENRQQEFTAKAADLADLPSLRWHFVGQVQTKKARAVRTAASAVHAVDRVKLVQALDRAGEGLEPLDVFLQVNLTDDPARGGASPDGIEELAEHIAAAETLRLQGVMSVAPLGEDPARAFARLADYAERVRRIVPGATSMSAGMSQDFAEAITAGATHLRIGTAITGARPAHG